MGTHRALEGNSHVAAALYLLGRRVATALRIRWADREILAPRSSPPPLRALHEALEGGDPVEVDPWVDLPDGRRGLVCLWAFADAAEDVRGRFPAELAPQVQILCGPSRVLVWLLDEPTPSPGGADPAHALAAIASAAGLRRGDPRDFVPLPRAAGDLWVDDPHRSVDPRRLVEWADQVLEQRAREEAARRALEEAARAAAPAAISGSPDPELLEDAAPEVSPHQGEPTGGLVTRLPSSPEALGDEPSVAPASAGSGGHEAAPDWHPAAEEEPAGAEDHAPTEVGLRCSAPEGQAAPGAESGFPAAGGSPPPALPAGGSVALPEEARLLLGEMARALGADPGDVLVAALAREAMRCLGTERAWEILGVRATRDDAGTLWGLRNGRWVRIGSRPSSP